MPCNEKGLGDVVAEALTLVGITEARVYKWIGDCECQERRAKLNQLGNWAARVVSGRVESALEYINAILHDD